LKRDGVPVAVTLASFTVSWGCVGALLYSEPSDDGVYVWAMGAVVVASAVVWTVLGRRFAPHAAARERFAMVSWGVAAIASCIVVPFFVLTVAFYSIAMTGAVGAGGASHRGTGLFVLLISAVAGAGISWLCSRRAVRAMR
jgi:hypothetical protein